MVGGPFATFLRRVAISAKGKLEEQRRKRDTCADVYYIPRLKRLGPFVRVLKLVGQSGQPRQRNERSPNCTDVRAGGEPISFVSPLTGSESFLFVSNLIPDLTGQ